uniref:Eukaryotic peptide chain release factor subunit 1-1 n=1 Tax=Arundo donax TaxID=35708 RepID=A0A0A9G2E9_ARUDO
MTFFHPKPSKTQSRLTSSSMLLWEINSEFVKHLTSIATQCAKKSSITIHNNEAKLVIRFQELLQSFSMELVVTKVQGCVDRLEGLKINSNFLFLAIFCNDCSSVENQTIWGNLVIQLQPLLS